MASGADGDAWLHRIDGSSPRAVPLPKPVPTSDPKWRAMADGFSAAITEGQVNLLASTLHVAATALRDLGIGHDDRCFTFPMFDAAGTVCGIRLRPRRGKKFCVKGSRLGIFRRLRPDDGLLLITEGESDAAAALTLGFDAVGVPGQGQRLDVAAAYARDRDVVVVADNDEVGEAGAKKLVAALQQTAKSVRLVRPPAEHKDLRLWLIAGASRADIEAAIAAAEPCPPADPEDMPQVPIRLGHRYPDATGQLVICPKMTMPTAEAFVREFHTHEDGRTLHNYAGSLWQWVGNRWVEIEQDAVKHTLQPWLHAALRPVYNEGKKKLELIAFLSNPTTVRAALESVSTFVHLPATTSVPSWLGTKPAPYPLAELLPCKTKTLHIPTCSTLLPSPLLFAFNALDFDYNPLAPDPVRWCAFLREVFCDDDEQIRTLQEWFGYCLTADTRQHKILLVIGPRRSGKGTIARVLEHLVGAANVVGPTVSSLAGQFGLQPLLGKTLAIVSDARFVGEHIATVTERVLCISGEDAVCVDRKHITSMNLRLPVRFMFLTNEMPRLSDASTALAGRFLVLRLTRSFYGQENPNLTHFRQFAGQPPGISRVWRPRRDRWHYTTASAVECAGPRAV
ncbi:MAG: DUF5906 domain-containing protein, partial [Planctomycetota bacterium]